MEVSQATHGEMRKRPIHKRSITVQARVKPLTGGMRTGPRKIDGAAIIKKKKLTVATQPMNRVTGAIVTAHPKIAEVARIIKERNRRITIHGMIVSVRHLAAEAEAVAAAVF